MKTIIYLALSTFFLLACIRINSKPKIADNHLNPTAFIAYLTVIGGERVEGEASPEIDDEAFRRINQTLRSIEEADLLKAYFYSCEEAQNVGKKQNGRLDLILREAQLSVLDRLAAIKTSAAAKVLVDIYSDEHIEFDDATAFGLGEAMVHCGEVIIPHLEKVKDLRPHISARVVECIQSGRSFL